MDRRAEFDQFVQRRTTDLLRVADLITWNRATAEDAVQEALLRVYRRWSKVRQMEFPYAYARRITVRVAVKMAGARHTVDLAEASEIADPRSEAEFAAIDEHTDLVAQLAALSAAQRAVLVLRYYEDLSEREIAELLDVPAGTVKSTASRALARLRRDHADFVPPLTTLKGVGHD